jgi:hypothetical protein
MGIDASLMVELQQAADNAAKGIRDPDAMRRAIESMDAAREELRKRVGILNIAVDLIRCGREQCD